jgi:hypothetical protein
MRLVVDDGERPQDEREQDDERQGGLDSGQHDGM